MNYSLQSKESWRHKKILLMSITVFIAVVALLPLLFPQIDSWDFVGVEMGFLRQDLWYFKAFKESHFIRYLMLLGVNELSLATNISQKLIFNIVAVVSIVGLSRATYVFLKESCGFGEMASLFGSWSILAFPVWHTLVSGAMVAYALFLWFFMMAVTQWYRGHVVRAVILLLLSLSYYSLFSLAVGFIVTDLVLLLDWKNWKIKLVAAFLISLSLTVGFALLYTFGGIHQGTGYNTFNLNRIASFGYYAIFTCVITLLAYAVARHIESTESRRLFGRHVFIFLILAFFSSMPYWLVDKPLRYFSFGSYTGRHTYLTSIVLALGVAVVTTLLEASKRKKILGWAAGVFFVTLLVVLHQGYSHKAACLVFRDMVTQSFRGVEAPPSGYVTVTTEKLEWPYHLHQVGLAMSLYRAYGKTAWMVNDIWRRRKTEPNLEDLKFDYKDRSPDAMKAVFADQVVGETYSRYLLALTGYHQEGRFWYWWYYLTADYSAFKPRLELLERR